jgi:ribosomal protein S18 acetylase RimI-like enzyme
MVQEIANNAWPAELTYLLNGWLIRITHGVTYRANSVLTVAYRGKNLESDITKVEQVYHSVRLSSKFMLHDQYEPKELKTTLIQRLYHEVMPTYVLGTKINDVPGIKSVNQYKFQNTNDRKPLWFSALTRLSFWRTSEQMTVIGEIMDRIKVPRKKFFYALDGDEIIGALLAIHDTDYIGMMNLAVSKKYQRLGIGTQLCTNAIKWGQKNGAKYIYLQVEKTNKPAIELYNKFHMKKWYSYSYFEKK